MTCNYSVSDLVKQDKHIKSLMRQFRKYSIHLISIATFAMIIANLINNIKFALTIIPLCILIIGIILYGRIFLIARLKKVSKNIDYNLFKSNILYSVYIEKESLILETEVFINIIKISRVTLSMVLIILYII